MNPDGLIGKKSSSASFPRRKKNITWLRLWKGALQTNTNVYSSYHSKFNMIELPEETLLLLAELEAPIILRNHLRVVHNTAFELISALESQFQQLNLNSQLILLGAAIHDIGKAKVRNELVEKGNLHEKIGYDLLIEKGFTEMQARFAKTHGNWQNEHNLLEDLLVSLSDKLWKGKRIQVLEELVCQSLSQILQIDYWETFLKADSIFERISLDGDRKIAWQNSHETH